MTTNEIAADLSAAALKSSPIAAVLALSLNDWVAVAAIIWTVLQGAYLVWKWRRDLKSAK